jgi:hypothetical protein
MERLLSMLLTLQASTAPIKLSIGRVAENNQVKHECIVIYECPPKIVTELVQDGRYFVEMYNGGLLVTVNPIKK